MVIILGSLYIPNIPLLVCGGRTQPTTLNPEQLVVSQRWGYLFGDPYNKDCNSLGSIMGFPCLGKPPTRAEGPCCNQKMKNHMEKVVEK